MKKYDADKVAEYSAIAKKKAKNPVPLGKVLIAVLSVTVAVMLAAVVCLTLYYTGVFDEVKVRKGPAENQEETPVVYTNFLNYEFNTSKMPQGYYADFTYECEGAPYSFTAYLFSTYAVNTVNNFVIYAKSGFYDGTTVKEGRVVTDEKGTTTGRFVCGGYVRDKSGKIQYKAPEEYAGAIVGEFAANGFETNRLANTAGVIGMIHSDGDPNDATTDFYVLPYDDESLNGYYAAFGKITTTSGLTAARQIARHAADGKTVTLKSVYVSKKS